MKGAVVLVGAGSAIARAIAQALAGRGHDLVLAGRRLDDLERSAADLGLRHGVATRVLHFEALAPETHRDLIRACFEAFEQGVEGIVLCHGDMPEEQAMREDPELALRMIGVNYGSAISLLEPAARLLADQARRFAAVPWIAAVSSVAGDRGRPSNYLYGSSKAALSTYLGGLRARMAREGVRVVTLEPGFVDTAMTFGRAGLFWVASPERVARDLLRGVERNRAVVYSPWFWAPLMRIIRAIPDRVFQRLDL